MKNFKKIFVISALSIGAMLPAFPLVSQASVVEVEPEVKPVVQPQAAVAPIVAPKVQPIVAPTVKDVVHPEVANHR